MPAFELEENTVSKKLSEFRRDPICSQVAKSEAKKGLTRWRGFCT